jgi:endoribonuclease Dicer
MVSLQESAPNNFEDTDSILEMSRKTLSGYHGKILYGLNTLGPLVTLEVIFYLSIEHVYLSFYEGL